MAATHSFKDSLALSAEHADAPWWYDVYRNAFPNLETAVSVRHDGWAQRGGIDRVLTLSSGKVLTVDEKVRAEDWPDILLEYWSSQEHRTPGWIAKDLACDYIAYAFIPSERCYLFPFQTLRGAWRLHCRDWVKKYRKVEARNQNYTTVSVAVPTDVLIGGLSDAMVVSFARAEL